MEEAGELVKQANKAREDRRNWQTILQDVWDYCFPMRQGFYDQASGAERMEKIYDETPIDAAAEFASIIMEGLFSGKWFRLVPGPDVPKEQREEAQRQLDDVNRYVYEILDQSNMESEMHGAVSEMAASIGSMYIKEGDAINPIVFQNVSMVNLTYQIDHMGRVDGVFRQRKLKYDQLEVEYPNAKFSSNITQKIARLPQSDAKILECCKRDWKETGTETHDFYVILEDEKELLEHYQIKGDGSKPWVNFRWSADCGEVHGRGPLITALPAIRNLNLVKEMGLENAQLHIGGIFQADDDGMVNFDNYEIVPMSVISRTPGSRGLEAVELPGNPDMTQFVIQDLQNSIRMILLNNEFGSLDKTPRSAQEIYGRYGKQMKKIRAPLKRLVVECVIPTAKRIIHILKKQGRITLPVIDGRAISIRARGPLIRMVDALENEDMLEFVSAIKQLYGPESKLYIKDDVFISRIAEGKEIPKDILVTPAERDVIIQNASEMMAQQQPQQQPAAPEMPMPGTPEPV